MALATYLGAGAVGFATMALFLWDLLDAPEDIEDVYDDSPWFQLTPVPAQGGAGAAISVRF